MGNQMFEIPCADRKTRERNLLNKYDRSKLYEENNDKIPKSQRILNQVENVIHVHERQTNKNSVLIDTTFNNRKNEVKFSGSPNVNDPLSTFESNDIESLRVDFSTKKSIISILNAALSSDKIYYLPTFVFPNPLNLGQTIIVSQIIDTINHIELNKDEKYEFEEKRIKLPEPNIAYVELKKYIFMEGNVTSEYIGYHHNPSDFSEYIFIFLKMSKRLSEVDRSKDSLNETHFEMQSLTIENLNSQDIMFKINERSKNDLVFKGIINLIGGKQSNKNLYVLLFGKSKTEDVEYFLNKISQQDEVSDAIINEETCKKIQLSCEADGLCLYGFVPLLEEKILYVLLGNGRN